MNDDGQLILIFGLAIFGAAICRHYYKLGKQKGKEEAVTGEAGIVSRLTQVWLDGIETEQQIAEVNRQAEAELRSLSQPTFEDSFDRELRAELMPPELQRVQELLADPGQKQALQRWWDKR